MNDSQINPAVRRTRKCAASFEQTVARAVLPTFSWQADLPVHEHPERYVDRAIAYLVHFGPIVLRGERPEEAFTYRVHNCPASDEPVRTFLGFEGVAASWMIYYHYSNSSWTQDEKLTPLMAPLQQLLENPDGLALSLFTYPVGDALAEIDRRNGYDWGDD